MFELASVLFSIADANEFRFARFYIVCEEVVLASLKSPLRLRGDKRRIIDGDTDILIVVSERFSVERDAADMLGVILDRETQADVAAVVQVKRERADIGDLKTVDVSAIIIDD